MYIAFDYSACLILRLYIFQNECLISQSRNSTNTNRKITPLFLYKQVNGGSALPSTENTEDSLMFKSEENAGACCCRAGV